MAGYSAALVGVGAIELMLQVYLLDLYLNAGLVPSMAGLAIALAVFWDAISDPLMGSIWDRMAKTRSSLKVGGTLVVGGLLLGLSFALLFSPPENSTQGGLFANLLICYLAANTGLTLFGVPHLALINELFHDARSRATAFAWRLGMGSLGLFLGIGLPAYFASDLAMETSGQLLEARRLTGWALGLIVIAAITGSAFSISREFAKSGRAKVAQSRGDTTLLKTLKAGFGSVRFRSLIACFAIIAAGRSFNSSLALPFYKGRLSFGESEFALMLFTLTAVIIVSAPVWVWLSRRYSKGSLFIVALLALAALTAIAYPLLQPEQLSAVLWVAGFGGTLVSSIVLLESLFSDYVEEEGARTNRSVAGAYFGLWRMLSKVARAIGLGMSGLALSAIGYRQGMVEQDESVLLWVAIGFGPGVALFFAAGALALRGAIVPVAGEERD